MASFIAANLAPIIFTSLVVFLLLGYPVAFSLAANGLAFFVIAVWLSPHSTGSINLSWPLLQTLPDRVFGVMANEVLLAIPFFTFMGLILERSGMAEDLLETVGQLFGTLRGGLAYAVVVVGALLAATTGVVAASVISMGLISLPIMLRYGYDRRLAAGTIAASGTLAQIIPPSLVLIVLADQLGKSVGDMYAGALIPGLMLAGLYILFVFIVSMISPGSAPGLPKGDVAFREPNGKRGIWQLAVLFGYAGIVATLLSIGNSGTEVSLVVVATLTIVLALLIAIFYRLFRGNRLWLGGLTVLGLAVTFLGARSSSPAAMGLALIGLAACCIYALVASAADKLAPVRLISEIAIRTTFVLVPPLLLIFLVLGTIFLGIATPTEGGAMGAIGAVVLAILKRFLDRNKERFNYAILRHAVYTTARLSSFVMFIVIGARVFSLTFYGVNGHVWVEHLLTGLPGGETGFLLAINSLIFVLAFFLDFFELAFIIVPLLVPSAEKLGIDLIWLGVMLGVNMQTSFLHPPFGFSLFYFRSVAPRMPYTDSATGRLIQPVTSMQIYIGAIPFVIIQLIMVLLIIAWPGLVTHYKSAAPKPDPSAVKRQMDALEPLAPPTDDLLGLPRVMPPR